MRVQPRPRDASTFVGDVRRSDWPNAFRFEPPRDVLAECAVLRGWLAVSDGFLDAAIGPYLAIDVIHVGTFETDDTVSTAGQTVEEALIGDDADDFVITNPRCPSRSQHHRKIGEFGLSESMLVLVVRSQCPETNLDSVLPSCSRYR